MVVKKERCEKKKRSEVFFFFSHSSFFSLRSLSLPLFNLSTFFHPSDRKNVAPLLLSRLKPLATHHAARPRGRSRCRGGGRRVCGRCGAGENDLFDSTIVNFVDDDRATTTAAPAATTTPAAAPKPPPPPSPRPQARAGFFLLQHGRVAEASAARGDCQGEKVSFFLKVFADNIQEVRGGGKEKNTQPRLYLVLHKLHDNQGSGLPPSDAPVWILGVCYKNGEGGGRATAAAEAAAEAAEDESNERVVVHKGAPSTSASASPPPPTTTTSGLDPEVAAAAASDWASIPWMTYRRGFPPIREDFDGDDDDGGGGGGGGGGGSSIGAAQTAQAQTRSSQNQKG